MPKKDDIQQSILVVSASEQFNAHVKGAKVSYITFDVVKSVALARRRLLEREYDLVVINAPLSDEVGEEFALDAAERGSSCVLVAVPRDVYEEMADFVIDRGILVIPKPVGAAVVDRSLRFLAAMRAKMRGFEKKANAALEKAEEVRIVSKAKLVLMETKHMTEEEAHKYIGRQAMNNGVSRRRVAEAILDDL
ncbi:MAG: ANTAR domain-containing protein [Lachnospiraceae bacterium]|nr:ANTAR domain-containing protein [Lachnospiraceae bacterium]